MRDIHSLRPVGAGASREGELRPGNFAGDHREATDCRRPPNRMCDESFEGMRDDARRLPCQLARSSIHAGIWSSATRSCAWVSRWRMVAVPLDAPSWSIVMQYGVPASSMRA